MLNFSGLAIAVIVVLAIWFGHVWVVKLYTWSGTRLWPIPLVIGAVLVTLSMFVRNTIISATLAILASTFFWGIKELFEQRSRAGKPGG